MVKKDLEREIFAIINIPRNETRSLLILLNEKNYINIDIKNEVGSFLDEDLVYLRIKSKLYVGQGTMDFLNSKEFIEVWGIYSNLYEYTKVKALFLNKNYELDFYEKEK
jgi:hypothetical protein